MTGVDPHAPHPPPPSGSHEQDREGEREDSGDNGDVDVVSVRRRIRQRGAAISRREATEAIRRLETDRELAPADRAAIRRLAARLVADLFAAPLASLAGPAADEAATAAALFGTAPPAWDAAPVACGRGAPA